MERTSSMHGLKVKYGQKIKRPPKMFKHKCTYIIKTGLRKEGCDSLGWIQLAKNIGFCGYVDESSGSKKS
jgi:hypothetical protein